MTLTLEDFRTVPHVRSRAWWTMRSMKIEDAVRRAKDLIQLDPEHDEWMLRLYAAKSLEPKVPPPLPPISRGELRYR